MKQTEALLSAMNLLDDALISEAIAYRPMRLHKWIAIAACLCLIATGAVFVQPAGKSTKSVPMPEAMPEPECFFSEDEASTEASTSVGASEEAAPQEAEQLIDGSSEMESSEACYPIPDNGTVYYTTGVRNAIETAEDKSLFVEINIFQDGFALDNDSEAVDAEALRLAELGDTVGWYEKKEYRTSAAEEVSVPYLYGIFSADALLNFQGAEDCGYFISFAYHGDGTPVRYEGDGNLIVAANEPEAEPALSAD